MTSDNLIVEKSKVFAIRVVRLYQYLQAEKKNLFYPDHFYGVEPVLELKYVNPLMGKVTKISGQSWKIALKEANETTYWLEIMYETNYLSLQEFDSIYEDCIELIKIMTSIVNTSLKNTTGYDR